MAFNSKSSCENQHVVVRHTYIPNKSLCNCCHTLIKKDYFNVFLNCILQDLVYNSNTCTSIFSRFVTPKFAKCNDPFMIEISLFSKFSFILPFELIIFNL